MSPIRVGLIGLSTAKTFTGPGCWTAVSHLPALLESPEYEIVALANSTVESAQRSIDAQGLPKSTKAYGSVDEIANDPDVDLIVVSVHVQIHYKLVKPALLRHKSVFVEWPLAANTLEVEELVALAKKNNVKTFVGFQGRASPMIQKVKEIIASNQIGRVLNSSVVARTTRLFVDVWPEGLKSYLDMASGGNEFTIPFGHVIDLFTHVLGDLSHVQSILKTQYKTVQIAGPDNKIIDPAYPKSTPDQILVQGITSSGAVASLSFRNTKCTADEHDLRWYISGTEGEILITGPSTLSVQDKQLEVRLKIGEGPFKIVDFQSYRLPAAETITPMAANVISMYDAFAKGDATKYATFESAAKTYELLEEIKKTAFID